MKKRNDRHLTLYSRQRQEFLPQGVAAGVTLLAFHGLILLMPDLVGAREEPDGTAGDARDAELVVSRVGALFLLLLYCQLLFFQLRTHTRLFAGDDRASTLPVSWTLLGLVLIAAALTVLSDRLVANIDGFCKEYHLGQAFVGVVVLPLMGIAVELISSVSVAVKDKMDLALGAWPVL